MTLNNNQLVEGLGILSFNIRSSWQTSYQSILKLMIQSNVMITCIQDVGYSYWNNMAKYYDQVELHRMTGNNNSRNMAIIVNKNIYKMHNISINNIYPWEIQICIISLIKEKSKIHILNVYLPPSGDERNKYMKALTKEIKNLTSPIIIVGDFNDVTNPLMDKWNSLCPILKSNGLSDWITSLHLVDSFQTLNPKSLI